MKFYSTLFLALFALVSRTTGEPTCQAVKGVYKDTAGASQISVPGVSLDVLYQLQVPSSSEEKFFNLLFDASQEKVANALVSTLFENCRDDSSTEDAAETVSLQFLTVDFGNNYPETVPKVPCGDEFECYTLEVHIDAMGARAVAPAEKALAVMHLEDAVRRAIREHSPLDVHDVATLRFHEFVNPNDNQSDKIKKNMKPQHKSTTKGVLLLFVGTSLLVLFMAGRRQPGKDLDRRSHHYNSDLSMQLFLNQLPSDGHTSNMEMALYKPVAKQQQDLDETENSESCSDEEDGEAIGIRQVQEEV
eukprot:scaffold1248_cov170-Amphora_coffeaeformis.AAC.23